MTFRIAILICFLGMSVGFGTNAPIAPKKKDTLPDSSEYVCIKDGHLFTQGKRVRYWGVIGQFPGKNYADNVACVSRLKKQGFNLVRSWSVGVPYVKGDGSEGDLIDHFLFCLKKEGFKVWFAGLNSTGSATAADSSIIADTTGQHKWSASLSALKQMEIRNNPARYWDARIQAIAINHMTAIAQHVNQYTGLRYCDDPLFAVWELSNEEWWFQNMKQGWYTQQLPAFFKQELSSRWNRYLSQKYSSHEALSAAWIGNFLPGESLDKRTIALLPLLGDVSDLQAASLGVGVAATGVKQTYDRSNFNAKRGADVIAFLLKIWIEGKQTETAALKKLGKSLALAPMVFDNGIGWDLPTQFMQQHADAISHDTYFNAGFISDPNHKRFPWMSQLEELPKVSWIQPWTEHNKMEGKPFFIYETQIMQPAKYRAEYPMELVKLGSIQDWDIINWHFFGTVLNAEKGTAYSDRMDYANADHNAQGYHFQFDEVQNASMAVAAEIFKNFKLKKAPRPTQFIMGSKSLYNWEANGYGEMGPRFVPTTYRYGMRLLIDSTRPNDSIIGPYYNARGVYESCPIVPTPEITHDWQKGYLLFDAPGTAMFTGFYAQYGGPVRFKNGIVLDNVTISNPKGMPYPVTEQEKYIAFGISSTDSLPLAKSKSVRICLVSTSFNANIVFHDDIIKNTPFNPGREWYWNPKAYDIDWKSHDVNVARVGATLTVPPLNGMKYTCYDWNYGAIETGTVANNTLAISQNKPVFLIELTR